MIYLVVTMVFLAVLFVSLTLMVYMRDRMNPATRRLLKLNQTPRDILVDRAMRQEPEEEEIESFFTGLKDKFLDLVLSLNVRSIESFSPTERIKFSKAGIRGSKQIRFYLGVRTLLSVIFPSVYLVYALVSGHDMMTIVLMGLFSFITGRFLFNMLLVRRIKKRNQVISKNVHDSIDLLMICLEAGLGLNLALLKVGENLRFINRMLAEEFLLLNHEIQAGTTRIEAYRNMRNRTDVRELRSLLTMLIQSETLGTSLGQVLRAYSDTLRTKIRQRAEEHANKAGVKLAIPLVVFIFPPLFLVVLGPAVLHALRILKGFIQ